MAYVGDKLVEIIEGAGNDPSVRNLTELVDNYLDNYLDPDFKNPYYQPPKGIISIAEDNKRSLMEKEIGEYCPTVGITNMYFSSDVPKGMDYVVIHTDQKFDLEALAELVPFLKRLKEKDFVYRVVHNVYSEDGDPEGVYSLYVLRESAFREAQKVWAEERLRSESIYAESDGQLSFPKSALSKDDEREIIDTLAEKLFGLKEAQ